MLAFRGRRRIEGWALDVGEAEGVREVTGLRQRIGENNKLWALSLIVLLLLTGYLVHSAKREGTLTSADTEEEISSGFYNDSHHTRFANDIVNNKQYGPINDAQFTGPGELRLIVLGDVSADDIDYASKMIAMRVLKQFKERVVVNVYMRVGREGKEVHVADTHWDPEKYGFVVEFTDESDALM